MRGVYGGYVHDAKSSALHDLTHLPSVNFLLRLSLKVLGTCHDFDARAVDVCWVINSRCWGFTEHLVPESWFSRVPVF